MFRPIELSAGAPSLNLVDTVATRETQPSELLPSPPDLDEWFRLAGFDYRPVGSATRHDLRRAHELREAVYRCAKVVTGGVTPAADDIDVVNRFARLPRPVPQWDDGEVVMTASNFFDAAFAVIAADAIYCLSGEQNWRLRACPECRMLFFDSSRPGKRVWCSSTSGCGNRAKVRRHRARKSQRGSGAGHDR